MDRRLKSPAGTEEGAGCTQEGAKCFAPTPRKQLKIFLDVIGQPNLFKSAQLASQYCSTLFSVGFLLFSNLGLDR